MRLERIKRCLSTTLCGDFKDGNKSIWFFVRLKDGENLIPSEFSIQLQISFSVCEGFYDGDDMVVND